MTREELESVIWRTATCHADEGTSGYLLTGAEVDAILAAADQYAEHVGGITAERRQAINVSPPPASDLPRPVHYQLAGTCPAAVVPEPGARSTANPDLVTCRRCQATRAWKETR